MLPFSLLFCSFSVLKKQATQHARVTMRTGTFRPRRRLALKAIRIHHGTHRSDVDASKSLGSGPVIAFPIAWKLLLEPRARGRYHEHGEQTRSTATHTRLRNGKERATARGKESKGQRVNTMMESARETERRPRSR
jgi:hypothetical protein